MYKLFSLAPSCICNKSCNFVFKYLIEKFIICRILNASKQLWMLGACRLSIFLYQDMHIRKHSNFKWDLVSDIAY
jgi:hypothetical protein